MIRTTLRFLVNVLANVLVMAGILVFTVGSAIALASFTASVGENSARLDRIERHLGIPRGVAH